MNTEHLSEERLALYVDNGLAPEEKAQVEDHLRACPRCLRTVLSSRHLRDMENSGLLPIPDESFRLALRKRTRGTWRSILRILAGGSIITRPGAPPAGAMALATGMQWSEPEELVLGDAPGAPRVTWNANVLVVAFEKARPAVVKIETAGRSFEARVPEDGIVRIEGVLPGDLTMDIIG